MLIPYEWITSPTELKCIGIAIPVIVVLTIGNPIRVIVKEIAP